MIKPLHQEEINDILNGVGVIEERPQFTSFQKIGIKGPDLPPDHPNCRCVLDYEQRRLHISVPVWCIIAGCMVGVGYFIGYYS